MRTLGRPVQVTDAMGYVTETRYDANGNITCVIDANASANLRPKNLDGCTVSRQYDELNRLTLERDALNGETRYGYDLLGNRTRVTDAEGRLTQFVFDDLGRLIEVRDPLLESPTDFVTRMGVDEAGNVIERTDRKGQRTRFTYDNLNRLTQASYADGSVVTQGYDVWGDLTSRGDANVTYTLLYDALHRPTRRSDSRLGGKALDYVFDAIGQVLVRTDYDGSRTDYQYDGSGRLVATRNAGYVAGTYQQDAAGRLLQRRLSNGATTHYGYDANGGLTSLSNTTDRGQVVNASQYTRDRTGRVLTDVTAEGTTTYSYDGLYRLIGADYLGAANDESFTYDKVGNRKTHTKGGVTLHHLHDANNRLLEVREGSSSGPIRTALHYDANGNLRLRCEGGTVTRSATTCTGSNITSYQWDARDRLVQVNLPNGTQERYAYDLDGMRIGVTDTSNLLHQHFREGEHLEAVYDSAGQVEARYLRGALIDEVVNGYVYQGNDWTNLSFHHDGLTSVVGLSSHDGHVLEQTRYSAFGERQSNVLDTVGGLFPTNKLRYTGREEETETGLYYYRARYYDAALGRFLSEDPLGFEAGINFYAYVNNDPVNANDPTGMLIYAIGGGGDKSFNKNVLGAVPGLSTATGQSVRYFTHDQADNVVRMLKGNAVPDMPFHLVGHSWGADAAITATAKASLGRVDTLLTVDPVGRYSVEQLRGAAANSGLWINLDLDPKAWNHSDRVAFLGRNYGDAPKGIADVYQQMNLNHGEFSRAIRTPIESWGNRTGIDALSLGRGGAAGGFVLYPSKANANRASAVYVK